jgi:hypothetical protein
MSAELIPAIMLAAATMSIMLSIFLSAIHATLMRIARALEERNNRG